MYWFDSTSEQSTSATANTNLILARHTGIAGLRSYIRRLQCGPNANAVDVQVRIRLQRTATALLGAGTGLTPMPAQADGPAATAVHATLPAIGTTTFAAVPSVQLAFNSRGTGLWFATVEDEAKTTLGAAVPNGEFALNSQQSGSVAVPVDYTLSHSE